MEQKTDKYPQNTETVLKVSNLSKEFATGRRCVKAVDNVSFELKRGEVLSLAGESGSGKSTVARLVTRLIEPDEGTICVCGEKYSAGKSGNGSDKKNLRKLRTHVQMIFQNAEGSFHPRMKIGEALFESIRNFRPALSREQAKDQIHEFMALVGLSEEIAGRYPWQISGGQCQRAAIVRALCAEPDILICDEATSALDVLVQARIIEILRDVQKKTGMSMLFISHDLSLVSCISDRVMILQKGRCVEEGETLKILRTPEKEYTRLLLDSIL